jgi:succinoglycan biosynthesis protein ExoO
MPPRVSVIIAAYNARDFIEAAVTSALGQTEKNLEVIVVDDCSSDGTADFIRGISDPRLRLYVLDRNGGPSQARNRAIQAARGDWITFLDADDWYAPDRIEVLLQVGEKYQTEIVADDIYRLSGPADPAPRTKLGKLRLNEATIIDAVSFLRMDCGLKPVIRRDFILRQNILFDKRLRNGEDTLLLLECLLAGARLLLWPKPYYYYREHEGSLSSFRVKALLQRCNTTQELLRREIIQSDPVLCRGLEARLAEAKKALHYYSVVEPLRQWRLREALRSGLFKPSFFLLLIMALPKVFNNRICRRLSTNT